MKMYEAAREAYEQTQRATVSEIEIVISLLKQVERGIAQLEHALAFADVRLRNETVRDIQTVMFELMSRTNRTTEQGERLFVAYTYLNQTFVSMRITSDYAQLPDTKMHILALRTAWEEALRLQRKRTYRTDQI